MKKNVRKLLRLYLKFHLFSTSETFIAFYFLDRKNEVCFLDYYIFRSILDKNLQNNEICFPSPQGMIFDLSKNY